MFKEIETRAEVRRKDEAAAKEKMADKAAAEANEKYLSNKLAVSERNFADEKITLSKVLEALSKNQSQLGSVQGDLKRSTTANLISVLGASEKPIEEIWLIMPTYKRIHTVDDFDRLLGDEISDSHCVVDAKDVSQTIWIPAANIYYPNQDIMPDIFGVIVNTDRKSMVFSKQSLKADLMDHWSSMTGRKDIESFYVERVTPKGDRTISSASYYSYVTSVGHPFLISVDGDHSKCLPSISPHPLRYFFDALLVLVLDKAHNETISFVLTADPVKYFSKAHTVVVRFKATSPPDFMTFPFREDTEEFAKQLNAQKD